MAPVRRTLSRPVVVTMQGEDLFLDGLSEPYRSQSIDLIRRQVDQVDGFIAVSEFYVDRMHRLLGIPLEKATAGYKYLDPAIYHTAEILFG